MTMLPPPASKKLGLVIDLDICVGCHACAVACKEWNDGGQFGPLPDENPYGREPLGVWFNRVHTYEVTPLPSAEGSGVRVGAERNASAFSYPHPNPSAGGRGVRSP
jgi:Fe-S-cluster-containing dehydrogenase component